MVPVMVPGARKSEDREKRQRFGGRGGSLSRRSRTRCRASLGVRLPAPDHALPVKRMRLLVPYLPSPVRNVHGDLLLRPAEDRVADEQDVTSRFMRGLIGRRIHRGRLSGLGKGCMGLATGRGDGEAGDSPSMSDSTLICANSPTSRNLGSSGQPPMGAYVYR